MKKSCLVLALALGLAAVLGAVGCGGATTTTAPGETTTTAVAAANTTTTVAATVTTTPPGTWADLNPGGALPPVRAGHSLVYDPDNKRVVLFGGLDLGVLFNDTWAYESAANAWTDLKPVGDLPAGRSGQSLVYDPASGKMILFGGQSGQRGSETFYDDTWAYDPTANTWTDLKPSGGPPPARSYQSMVYHPGSKRMILHGGQTTGDKVLGDIWAYDPAANIWVGLNPAGGLPSARTGHSMVFDPAGGKVVVFGGFDGTKRLNETWAYDPAANLWADLKPAGSLPSGRVSQALDFDPAGGRVILFGGYDGTGSLNDTWAFGARP